MSALLRRIHGLVAPQGRGARLNTLIYHRVLPGPDPMRPGEVDAATFDAQMALLAREFNVLPADEAVDRLLRGTLPARAAVITFDDGYADNAEMALPILRRHGITATFFIATGYLNGGCMWNDTIIEAMRRVPGTSVDLRRIGLPAYPVTSAVERRLAADDIIMRAKYLPALERDNVATQVARMATTPFPNDLMMTDSQVRELAAAGMGIGAHTEKHPILACASEENARAEIEKGKRELESIIGREVRLFAYPNGKPGRDYLPAHVHMVRDAGFKAAFTTAWGVGRMAADCYELPRFTPWDRTLSRFQMRLIWNALH